MCCGDRVVTATRTSFRPSAGDLGNDRWPGPSLDSESRARGRIVARDRNRGLSSVPSPEPALGFERTICSRRSPVGIGSSMTGTPIVFRRLAGGERQACPTVAT